MIGAVYVVTDAGSPHAPLDQALAAAQGGAWAVQLRDKDAADAEFAALARAMLARLRPLGVKLFVNDRVEIARALGVDGLHIGQKDGDPRAARLRLGPALLLGLSIENEAQLNLIPAGTLDYIGVGPVRATATKPDHAPPIGFEGLARIAASSPRPVVAIGGLGLGDAAALKAAGAAGMAVVSAVTRAADPLAATRALVQDWSRS